MLVSRVLDNQGNKLERFETVGEPQPSVVVTLSDRTILTKDEVEQWYWRYIGHFPANAVGKCGKQTGTPYCEECRETAVDHQ